MQRFRSPRRPVLTAFMSVMTVLAVCFPANLRGVVAQETEPAAGGATDPIVVITVASMNKLMEDVSYVTAALGYPQFGALFQMTAGGATQGLDTARPIGIFVPLVDGSPQPVGVVPTNDIERVLKGLEGQLGPADKLDDGTFVVAAQAALVYIRQVGSWAVVAASQEMLDRMPEDPLPLMGGMGEDYDLAVRVRVQEIPLPIREMLVGQLREGFEGAALRQGDEEVLNLGKAQMQQFESLVRDTDELMLGINISPNERMVSVDTEFTAAPGTDLAKMYAGQQPIKSMFTGVLQGESAIRYHYATAINEETLRYLGGSVDTVMAGLNDVLDEQAKLADDVRADIGELVDGLLAIGQATLEQGKADFGLHVVAGDGVFRLAGGSVVHDGEAVAQWVKNLDQKLRQLPDPPQFRFDESTYENVSMHSISIDIPAKQAELRELLGQQAVIHLGTGPQAAYFALGDGSVEMMKALIDTADKDPGDLGDRPLGQLRIELLPILRLAQSIKPDDSVAAVVDAVALAGDTDELRIISKAIDNGQSGTVQIGEGLLKAIGAMIREAEAAKMRQLQQGGDF